MLFTLTFAYVSPETQDYAPLVDQFGNDITLQVEAPTKSATYSLPQVADFCKPYGNDCRIGTVTQNG